MTWSWNKVPNRGKLVLNRVVSGHSNITAVRLSPKRACLYLPAADLESHSHCQVARADTFMVVAVKKKLWQSKANPPCTHKWPDSHLQTGRTKRKPSKKAEARLRGEGVTPRRRCRRENVARRALIRAGEASRVAAETANTQQEEEHYGTGRCRRVVRVMETLQDLRRRAATS